MSAIDYSSDPGGGGRTEPCGSAVIFDCDGVLVESEVLGNEVLAQVMTEHGLPMTAADSMRTFMGMSMGGIIERSTQLAGRDMRHACESVFVMRLVEAFRGGRLRAVEGVAAIVAGLPGPKAVASNSPVERLMLSLEVTGYLPHFGEHIYSGDQVARPKPAPDVFLHAAERVGVPPAACIVIEDGPGGVRAAREAGMRCIGFTGGLHCDAAHIERLRAAGPDVLVGGAAGLAAALRGMVD